MDIVHHVLAHDERVPERTEIGLKIGDRTPRAGFCQVVREMAVQARRKHRRIVGNRRGNVVHRFRQDRIGLEMCAPGGKVAGVTRGNQRPRDELGRPAARQEIRQHLVISGFRECHLDGPRPIRLLFRVNVLEVLHVLADDKQVILPFVHDLESLDRLARARMEDSEAQCGLLPRLHHRRRRGEVQTIIAHVKRRRAHQRHSAARTLPFYVQRVVGMHRAHIGDFILRRGRDGRSRGLGGGHKDQHERHESTLCRCFHACHQMSTVRWLLYDV